MNDEYDNDAKLPDELVAALRKADQAPAMITSRVDREVGNQAVSQFRSRPGRARRARYLYAAAASLLVVALLLPLQPHRDTGNQLYSDVDGSGQIDIADVMALAIRDDGRYTQDELEAFALSVVAVGDDS